MAYRFEHDLLGEREVPAECYYGIHTLRAVENFNISGRPIRHPLVIALAMVKKAAALANLEVGLLEKSIAEAITSACDEVIAGGFREQFLVDALQGGAGTSANMNVNEVIANLAIEKLHGVKGDYRMVHPLNHVNMSQSTNDVFPTAVRIAAINLLKPLSENLAGLQAALQQKEEQFSGVIKMGRTELQDALPVMLGQEFGAYAQAIARDRWRIYKVEERLRQVNLGGTAVGTGLNADRRYIFSVIEKLRDVTGLGLSRAEYPIDLTQNNDVFAEVSGMLKTVAVNLAKIANDLRLMASGPHAGFGEINLPEMQAGSSIMPGKINPVIPEAVRQATYQVMASDTAITMGAASGELELNAMLPLIADNLFNSLELLNRAVVIFKERCIQEITVNAEHCKAILEKSMIYATALTPYIGYEKATLLVQQAKRNGSTIREEALRTGLFTEIQLNGILDPYQLTKPGIPGKKV